ncbi:aldolase/citrate lyase family protein [Aeromonas dhakensis]|uniref:HpcH/HpaI aldolase family protein n=1 Tax=Aeromonas dhakensis TaxID=196024 RepID=UPI00208E58E8|nr:aldolase/citrate lyase family protein [Aeromonas dhakensis]USP10225.1 aldolase/citrate lyase family protein [Aeromonas dhakensis]
MSFIKDKLQLDVCIGLFSKTIDASFIEATGYAGMNFVIIDMEHGLASSAIIHDHARAAKIGGVASIVRVSGCDPHAISSALDSGADGVQIPNINTAEQAQAAVHAARFHPLGKRGVCRFVRAAKFGTLNRDVYFESENNKLIVLQVEGVEGVKNINEILNVDGFDVLFVGPYDLSQSVGIPGDITAPEVNELINNIAMAAARKGKTLGVFADSVDMAKKYIEAGFKYIAYSVDVAIFADACSYVIRGINE